MPLHALALEAQTWTPELVLERISTGLRIVASTVAKGGPRPYGNAMPEIFHEFEDHVGRDWEPGERLEEWMTEIEAKLDRRFSGDDIALADEALAWPSRFLFGHPLQRDAIWLSALSSGLGADLEKILRRRRRQADAKVERRKEHQPDLIRIYEDDAQDAAAKIVFWANAALAKTSDGRKRARIRQAARIRFRREVRAGAIVELHTYVRRCDVEPGKLYNYSRVHFHRAMGAQAIADGLAKEGAPVR